jgi:hypothetical protein
MSPVAIPTWLKLAAAFSITLAASVPPAAPGGLQAQLEGLVLPTVDVDGAPLKSVLEALRKKAVTASGSRVQPGFAIDPQLDTAKPITLHLANAPFMEVLRYLSDLAGADFAVDAYAISAKPKATTAPQFAAKTPITAQQQQMFEQLVLPDIDLRANSLNDALGAFEEAGRRRLGARGDVLRFVSTPEVNGSAPVTLHLVDIPLAEGRRYFGDLAGVVCDLNRFGISIHARAPDAAARTA